MLESSIIKSVSWEAAKSTETLILSSAFVPGEGWVSFFKSTASDARSTSSVVVFVIFLVGVVFIVISVSTAVSSTSLESFEVSATIRCESFGVGLSTIESTALDSVTPSEFGCVDSRSTTIGSIAFLVITGNCAMMTLVTGDAVLKSCGVDWTAVTASNSMDSSFAPSRNSSASVVSSLTAGTFSFTRATSSIESFVTFTSSVG